MCIIWMFLAASLLLSGTVSADVLPVETNGYIIVGDSRTVGMEQSCDMSAYDNVFVVAKVGEGYHWLVNDAMPQVEAIKAEHSDIDHWTIVSNLGVNDLGSCSSYIDFYKSLEDDFIYMSANPVKGDCSVTNESIDNFNSRMREEFEFIDTNAVLHHVGYSAPDGLHYSRDTYKFIFAFLIRELGII